MRVLLQVLRLGSLFTHPHLEPFSFSGYPLLSTVRMPPSQRDNPPLDLWDNGVRIMHSMTLWLTKPVYMPQRYSPADQPIQIDTFAAGRCFHRNKSSFSRSSFASTSERGNFINRSFRKLQMTFSA